MSSAALQRPRWFVPFAISIAAICLFLVRSQFFQRNPEVAAWGVTFDLTLSIPLIYYIFVIRPGHARPLTIAPLFVAGVAAATLIVPRRYHEFLQQLRFVSAPLEVVTLALVGQRILRMRNAQDAGDDPHSRIVAATRGLLGDTPVATFVAMEITIVYYGLFTWRKPAPTDERAITVMERSGWGSIVACIIVLLLGESAGLHFLMLHWFGPLGAWCVTALDAYAIVWIFGDYHALRLRPTLVKDGVVHVRHGLRWSMDVALVDVASIDDVQNESDWKRKGVLRIALFDEPRFLVRLKQPQTAQGLVGITRTIDTLAVRPDDEERFRSLLLLSAN